MSAAIALGGFTGPEADTLGYAIRKKKSAVLRAQKEKFVTQAAERGVEPKVIDAVFKAFEPFERYGFNKAHATCYGLIAYQTAYMKANHTVDYMTAVLTAFRSNEEKVAAAVAECRRMAIEVLPPGRPPQPARVHGRGRRHPVRAAGGQERRPGRHRIDHRGARRGRSVPLADRLLHPDRPAAGEPQGARGAGQGRCPEPVRAPGPDPARPRRCDRRGAGDPAGPDLRADIAVRPRRDRCGRLRTPAPGRLRGARPRAAALGEGAPRPVPVRAPDGRGRRAGRPLRDRLLERPARRIARRPAGRRRRHRHRRADRHHQGQGDDGHRDRWRTCRERSRSSSSRGSTSSRPGRGATARSCSSPVGSTTRARTCRCWPTWPSSGTRPRPPARRRSHVRSRPATEAGEAGVEPPTGTGTATGTVEAGVGRWSRSVRARVRRWQPASGPASEPRRGRAGRARDPLRLATPRRCRRGRVAGRHPAVDRSGRAGIDLSRHRGRRERTRR